LKKSVTSVVCDATTAALLRDHPFIQRIDLTDSEDLQFDLDGWRRAVRTGPGPNRPFGLVELEDNNPLVCADEIGLPSAAGSLALIAVGPLVEAGILIEAPSMLTNAGADELLVARDLESVGWHEGVTLSNEPLNLEGVFAATVIAAIRTPEDLNEIDDLYEERFGRSYFVRRDEASTWDINLVHGRPHAAFRLRISPDDPHSLLTIQVMADAKGKCGAAQRVHAMNVMCGFEETLGLL
jgi:N-acetyl-gamma-glutamylphosphate reductase